MRSQTPDIQHLSAALERFHSTRSAYLSTSDQAMNALLTTLAETLIGIKSAQSTGSPTHLAQTLVMFQATRPPTLSTADQALSDLLTALGEQVIGLSSAGPAAPAGPPDSGIAALQSQIDTLQLMARSQDATIRQLRAQLSAAADKAPRWNEQPQLPPVQPAMMRPLEYWAEHVPDFGEDGQVSPSQMHEHLSRPRVRPEDVVLTPEELRRIQRAERPPYRGNPDEFDPRVRWFMFALAIVLILLYLTFFYL